METAISNRIAAIETFVQTAQTQLDGFMQRNNELMQMISDNDVGVKTAFETRVNAMEMEYRTALTDASAMTTLIGKNSEDIKTAMSSMSDVITKQETEIIVMQQSMQRINLAIDTTMAPLHAAVAGRRQTQ